MTRKFYFNKTRTPICQEVEGTIYWYEMPRDLVARVHAVGPSFGIIDDLEQKWTGDEFWDYTGHVRNHDLSWVVA